MANFYASHFLLSFLMITLVNGDGWKKVERQVFIDHDLEKSPLEIKTDSAVGSRELMFVKFNSGTDLVGGFGVSFSSKSTPKYYIYTCNKSWTKFPTDLPSDTDKVWRITMSRTTDGDVRLIIHCNNKEVLNFILSDTTCSAPNWSKRWSRDVKMIRFSKIDKASDFYREMQVECSAGTYRSSTVTSCTKCPVNTITEQSGATSCTVCPAGTVSNDERIQCVECSAGTYRDSTVTSCTKCPVNTITEQSGATLCTVCPAGTVSNDERIQCDQEGDKAGYTVGVES